MTTTHDVTAPEATTPAVPRGGTWIDDWRPEDPAFWEAGGRTVARRNLVWSIFSEHLGFSVWLLWSVSAALLLKVGFTFSPQQLFVLIAVPNLVGALIRLPYTFAVPKFGGRNWTVVSALLLLVPTLLFAWFVQHPETPYWVFLLIAATAGLGGGNFASSMANINFFYPTSRKGTALGLNAAGGNLGVAFIQLFLPIVVGGAGHLRAGAGQQRRPAPRAGRLPVRRPRAGRGRVRVPLHEQPDHGEVQPAGAAVRGPQQAHLGDVVPLHRHLRVVHRLLRGDAAADQAELLGHRPRDRCRHRHQLRLLRVPRRAGRVGGPAVRWLAGRQVRRRPGDVLDVRRDDRRHPGGAVDAVAADPEPDPERGDRHATTSRGSPGSWPRSCWSSRPPASATARRTG